MNDENDEKRFKLLLFKSFLSNYSLKIGIFDIKIVIMMGMTFL